ncbi:hypothetical protein [Streptomyces sp. SBT349]|uniref:hypothetical protein n=1 Tax=Streptomyces sp. SBT349 TaxID=1580539 RepID=UPI000AE7B48C|nr:hypothetical protein [Streptomyces sp. SBT349]
MSAAHAALPLYVRGVGQAMQYELETGTGSFVQPEKLIVKDCAEFQSTFLPWIGTKPALSDEEIRVQVTTHADAHLERGRTAVAAGPGRGGGQAHPGGPRQGVDGRSHPN